MREIAIAFVVVALYSFKNSKSLLLVVLVSYGSSTYMGYRDALTVTPTQGEREETSGSDEEPRLLFAYVRNMAHRSISDVTMPWQLVAFRVLATVH
jgi:hypothetical protein